MIYQLKFSGILVRFDYLIELFCNYYKINDDILTCLVKLKEQWSLIINELRKYCLVQKNDYCQ